MNGQQLYTKIKLGQINKNQLTDNEKGELYKYMVESNKISSKEVKPEVVKKYNLAETPKNVIPERQPTYTPSRSPDTNAPITPINRGNIVPDIGTKSTNPELELVDVLSNLTFPQRGRKIINERSQAPATLPILKDTIQDVKGGINNAQVNYGLGKLSETENQLWAKYRSSQSEEDLLKAQQASQMTQDYMLNNPNVGQGNWITQDFAQYMPQMFNQMKAGLGGASKGALTFGGTAALLGQAGPQAAIPEEIITVPAAMFMGGKAGYMTGVGEYSYNQMAGAAYKGLLDLGVPNDVALNLSRDEGIVSSLIEAAGAGVDIATLGISKLFKDPAGQVAKNRILSALKAYGTNVLSEGLEEGLQEAVSIGTEKRALGDSRDSSQDLQRIKDSVEGGIAVSAVSGGGNAIGNVAVNTINNKRIANIKQTLDTELNTIYQAMDNGTPATEQDLNKTVEFLQGLEKQYPDLQEYLQGHIEKVDRYKEQLSKPLERPTTSKIDTIDTLLDDNTNVALNSSNDLTDDISTNMLQESNSNVTETQQDEIVDDNKIEDIEMPKFNLVSLAKKFNEAMQSNAAQEQIESDFKIDYVEQLEDNIINFIESNDVTDQEKNDFVNELRNQLGDTDAANELWELGLQDYWTVDNTEAISQAVTEPTTNETIPNKQIVDEDTNIAQTEDKGVQEAINKFASKLFDSYLLSNKIDRNTLSDKQINSALEQRKQLGQELVDAIQNKDFDVLTERLNRGNILSLKLFTDITGLPTNTQKITDANIRSLDPDAYNEWANKKSEERKQAEEKTKAEQLKTKEEEKQNKLKATENIKIKYKDGVVTLKEYAEKLKAEGYRYVETNEFGGYELRSGKKPYYDGKDYTNKDVRQYLRNYFRDLAKTEQEESDRKEQEEYEALSNKDKEAIDSLFNKGGTAIPIETKGNIKPIVDYLKNKLDNNEKMQPSELYSLANNYYGGLQTSGAYKTKDAYELLETALNKYIIDNVNLNSSTSKEKVLTMLDKMDNMLSLIPTQTKRSDEQIAKQQFSTPPNISLIAGWTARIKSSDHVLEPSAGNGGLALWGITANAEVTVNEIDQQRMNNLKELDFDNYFMENAEQLDRILPDKIKPTVVIMNPPFSTSLNMDTKNSDNVKKHIGQALDRLQENGRAVIIAGNTLAEGKPKFSGWWKEIKGKYNVRANITIDGENYRKYGTTFDIQMIVIDKNGATQGETLTGSYKNLEDVINALEGVRNERPEIRNNQSVSRSESTTNKPSDTQNGTEVQSTVGTSTRNDSSSTSSNGSIGDRGGLVESTGKRDNERNNADGVDRGTIQQTTNTELSESSSRSDIERGTTENTTSGNIENEIIGTNEQLSSEQHGSNIDRIEDVVKVKNKKPEKVNTDLDENRVFETYRPEKLDLQNAKPHPAELVESAAMSAVSPPDITYSPAIPNDIIKKGLLSDAQMEAVVYAGQAHSQKLPNGTTKGYYIGDGTGVGKGREIAGIIFDNYMQGRKKAIWVTMNTDLIKDAKRDIEGIGWKDGNVISNLKKGEKIKDKEGVLVTTYGTISSSFSKEVVDGADGYKLSEGNRIRQMYEWLGKDFDGVIAFDEAHKMKSGLSVKKSRGKSKPSDTALAGIALQELFPKAKIVYVSATNAVNVEDLAYGQRLGLWGEGTAFPTVEAFVSEISKGGVAAMELVSRDMKSMGLYTARSISFNGVEYDRLEHKLSKEQVAIYDKIADAWQIILKNVNAAIDATQAQGKHRGAAYSAFWSSNQRFFNQILTSMQMPSALEDMKKQIADGKSIVLQIVSTNEASLERKISSAIEEGLSPDEMDLTPRELLVSYLEKSFPVQQFEIVVDDNGNEHSVPVTDSQGNPVLNREAVKMRDDMIADIQDMPIPDDVLTMLFNEFGSDQVAEITGRKRRVVNKVNEKTGVLERVIEKISSKAGEAEEAAFMNGDKRVLIFSKAGGTGRSYHASKDVKNQQQRVHYLIEAGYSAMDAVQGFGRTHRSNESSAPIYKLVSTDLSGQKRFLSTIARRLGQLGAMTKGQRQASGGMFSEKDNLEGPLASDSLYNLYKDISNGLIKGLDPKETFEILGLNGMLDEYGNLNEKSDDLRNIPKFLNRILSLPVKLQNDIFSQFEIRLDMAMDYAMQNGSLDVGLEVLKGESVDIESKQLLRENKDLNTKTELVKLKVGEKVKKTKFKELSKDRLIGYYQNDRSGSVRAVYSMGMTTKTNGSIVERIRMVGQAQHQNAIQDIDTIQRSNWNEISESEANTLWNDAYNEVSDIKYNTVNMVTGTLLPIWDKLPSDKTRVMRTVTSDGEQLLGRILNERQLEIFMQRMGMNIDREKYTNKGMFDEVYKNGKTAHIDNGWKIKSSRVNNEKRLEITGDDFYFYKDRFEKLGLFREYVNSKSRWFIPVNSDTVNILNELLKYNEIIKIADESSGTQAFKGIRGFKGMENTTIDMSRPLKKPSEIKSFINKTFKVPMTSKKFNKRKAIGFYNPFSEVIRTKYENDIGTVMHELGHHLDKKYNFSRINPKLIQDMIDKLDDDFRNAYKEHELPGEVVAEFLHYYTTDIQTARDFSGDFFELFEETLSKEDLKNIHIVRSDVLRWVNAERSEKRQSTIVPLSQKKKLGERISEVINFEKYNMILFDKYAPLQRFVNTVEKLTGRKIVESLNPHVLVERTYKNDAVIEGIIRGQLRDTKGEDIQTKDNLQKIVNEVGKDMTAFEDYLKLKHAITLENKGHQIYSRDIYNSVQEMEQDLATIEQEHPKFIEQSERLYDWYDKFFKAWVVDTNMLGKDSKKAYQTMREEYPYYVPMFRVREDNSTKRAKSSLTDQKSPIDRLSEKGNDQDTISPIDNIITQVSRMVNAYSKNNVMRAIVENYNTVDGLGGFIDRVPPDMEKQIISTQSIKDMIDYDFKKSDNAELIDNIINAIPDLVENYKTLTVSKDQEIVGVIAEDGSRRFYQVFDKAFLDSLTNMNPTQLDATVRLIASVRRTTTALTTGLNPIFSIASNAPRDFTQAYIFGSYKNPVEYVYQYAKALINVATKTGNYKKFKELGGVYGSSMTSELRNKNDFIRHLDKYRKGKKIIPKNALHYIGEFILDINDAIETAPRLAEFNKAYKLSKNKSEQDRLLYALSKADDVTLNFSRKGTIMNTWVGQSIPYLNAGLQGMDKLRRGMFTGEEKAQTFIKALTMLTIPTILLWLAHRDDEDYERLSKGIKDNYWILWKRDDGSFFRIPKPKDLSAIFSSDFERALNAYFKEEGAGAFEGFQSTMADALLPPTNTIFGPLIDVAKNEKWSGSKIVGMSMSFLPKTEQYDDTTSRIGVIIAQAIGKVLPGSDFASPKNVDYLLDQYYGGLADILLPLTTPNSYTTAEFIKRKFSADPSYSNDVVNDFYELRDKTMKANKAYDDRRVLSDDVDLIAGQQFKAYYKVISAKWKDVDYIGSLKNKSLTKEEKQAYTELVNQSRYVEGTKQKVREDLKDGKLSKETITILQKTIRDDIVKTAEKAVKEYKATHKMNNEKVKQE